MVVSLSLANERRCYKWLRYAGMEWTGDMYCLAERIQKGVAKHGRTIREHIAARNHISGASALIAPGQDIG